MGWLLSHIIPAHIETVDFQAAIFPQLSIYARVYPCMRYLFTTLPYPHLLVNFISGGKEGLVRSCHSSPRI